MEKGFYIFKVKLSGNAKKAAEIELKPGLNVIAGASNTGKTYIFQCIDFMLGGKKSPKPIPEAIGYTEIFLEIKTFSGSHFRLRRSITGGEFHIKNLLHDEGELTYLEKLSNDSQNISTFLLELCALDNVSLKKNQQNKKVRLSFRDVAGLCLVDEKTIISEDSPVFQSGESVARTKEKSLFYYLLTNQDAADFSEIEDPKVLRNKIAGKIEFLKEIIARTQKDLDEFKGENLEDLKASLLDEYEKTNLEYRKSIKSIDHLRNERSKYYKNIEKVETKLLFKSELLQRFNLLEKHYNSDLQRMEFVEEGSFLLNQLNNKECPICGSPLTDEHLDHLNQANKDSENLLVSITQEGNKIKSKISELSETIKTIVSGIDSQNKSIDKLRIGIANIDNELNNSLTPVSKSLRERMQIVFDKKTEIENYSRLKNNMQAYYGQLNDLNRQLNLKVKQGEEIVEANQQSLTQFCSIIEEILNSWKYPNITNITFDQTYNVFDIKINNVSRASNGKGYRAITYSSFVFGIMKYCEKFDQPHPYFILLDSPLTTFKEQDANTNNNDKIDSKMEPSFFESFSKIGEKMQVIILENKEPDEELKMKMNYVHFSGKDGVGRNGFF